MIKNKKAEKIASDTIVNTLLWIMFVILGGTAVYFIVKKLFLG